MPESNLSSLLRSSMGAPSYCFISFRRSASIFASGSDDGSSSLSMSIRPPF